MFQKNVDKDFYPSENAMFPTDSQQDRGLPGQSEARWTPRHGAHPHAGGGQFNAWLRARIFREAFFGEHG